MFESVMDVVQDILQDLGVDQRTTYSSEEEWLKEYKKVVEGLILGLQKNIKDI